FREGPPGVLREGMGNRDTRGRATAAAPSTLIAVLTQIVTSDSGGPSWEPGGRRTRAGPFPPQRAGARSRRSRRRCHGRLIRYEHWGREQGGGWGQCHNPSAMCVVPLGEIRSGAWKST